MQTKSLVLITLEINKNKKSKFEAKFFYFLKKFFQKLEKYFFTRPKKY